MKDKVNEEEEEQSNKVVDGGCEERVKRLAKLKQGLHTRSTLYKPEVMVKLYETQAEKKKAVLSKKVEELKKKGDTTNSPYTSKQKNVEKKKKSDSVGNVGATSTASSSKQAKLRSTPNAGYERVLNLPNQESAVERLPDSKEDKCCSW